MGIVCFLPLDPQRDFCLVWAIGGSEMLVGTVMASGAKVYVFIWNLKTNFEVQNKIVFCDVKIPKFLANFDDV